MGAKTWMLVCSTGNAAAALRESNGLNHDATLKLVKRAFPKENLKPTGETDLSYTCPPDDLIHAACFPNVSILAAKEFGIDHPSKLPSTFLSAGDHNMAYLHAMHSVVDWFGFAQWTDGQLIRSLSVSGEQGIILEDIGSRLLFEEPYWAGQHPLFADDAESDYPFPFHPLELGEAALKEFFGYQLEGPVDSSLLDPESVPLIQYKRSRSRWKLW